MYVFEHNPINDTWNVITKLVATDGVPLAYFGASIALDGTMLAVSASGDDSEKGAVYLFEESEPNNGWYFVLKIVAENAETGDNFGNAIALGAGTLAIGTRSNDDLGFEAGTVYLYEKDQGGVGNWGFVKKVFSIGTSLGDYFGTSVALDGGTLVLGAMGDDVTFAQGAGTVTVFDRDQGDHFGTSLALDNDTLVVGAPFDDLSGMNPAGRAIIFQRDQGGADQRVK